MELERYMPRSREAAAILACGGKSERMGRNKLLIDLCGKSCIRRSAEALLSCADIKRLVVAAPPELWKTYAEELRGLPVCFAEAGENRPQSVKNAFKLVDGEIVVIHDGARPLVSEKEVSDSVGDAFRYGTSVVCTPVKDTIRFYDGGESYCPPRDRLYTVRTPQSFSARLFGYVLENASGEYTDEAQLFDEVGIVPHITVGSYRNIKLTTEEDIALAERFLEGEK